MCGYAGVVLRLGTFTPSVLLRVARVSGRLGGDFLEVPVSSSRAQFAALLDGSLDAALTSPDNVLAHTGSAAGTVPVEILAGVDRGLGLALYSDRAPAELRGATFGVDVPGSGFALVMYALAESIGLTRADYQVVALGSTPKRLAALRAGECAATMLNAGNDLLAEEAGFTALARVAQPYLGSVLVGRHSYRDLRAALVSTADGILAGSLDAEVLDQAGDVFGAHLAGRYLARLKDPDGGLVPHGVVDPDAMRAVIELRHRYEGRGR